MCFVTQPRNHSSSLGLVSSHRLQCVRQTCNHAPIDGNRRPDSRTDQNTFTTQPTASLPVVGVAFALDIVLVPHLSPDNRSPVKTMPTYSPSMACHALTTLPANHATFMGRVGVILGR